MRSPSRRLYSTAPKERLSAGRLVEIVETPCQEDGGGGSVAVVLVKKHEGGAKED